MGLLSEIEPLKRTATSLREIAMLKEANEAAEAKIGLGPYELNPANLENAATFGTPETLEKRYSFKISPVLRSITMETGDDAEVTVQRLVGGEASVTLRF